MKTKKSYRLNYAIVVMVLMSLLILGNEFPAYNWITYAPIVFWLLVSFTGIVSFFPFFVKAAPDNEKYVENIKTKAYPYQTRFLSTSFVAFIFLFYGSTIIATLVLLGAFGDVYLEKEVIKILKKRENEKS